MPSKKPKLDTFRKVANACGGILSDIAANLGVSQWIENKHYCQTSKIQAALEIQ